MITAQELVKKSIKQILIISWSCIFSVQLEAAANVSQALKINLLSNQNSLNGKIITPIKRNKLEIDGQSYFLPDYLKIIEENGKFQILNDFSTEHKVGNGGDYLRGQFLAIGNQVLRYLEQTEDGQKLLTNHKLSLEALKASLDITKIAVVDDLLIDNSGSVVDAIGVPDLIILNSDSWNEHFEKERNIYYLVFHEMLRSAAINDDNYVISQAVINFPVSLKISTKLVPAIPLLAEDSLSVILANSKIVTGGTGCINKENRLFSDLNLLNNVLDLTFYDYVAKLKTDTPFERKSCSVSIPVSLPKNKMLVISLIDIQGQVENNADNLLAVGRVSFEAFLAGSSQKIQTKTIALNQGKKSFLYRKTNVLNSTCGGDSILRLNSNVILNKGTAVSTSKTLLDAPQEMLQVKKISIYMSLENCTK